VWYDGVIYGLINKTMATTAPAPAESLKSVFVKLMDYTVFSVILIFVLSAIVVGRHRRAGNS